MLKFYDVDRDYVAFLKEYESKVPNISYAAHDKFICGVVLEIDGRKYYAPISSFSKPQRTNFLLKNSVGRVTSSIRLSFMFPVPDDKITLKNFSLEEPPYRRLLMDEYKYCNVHEAKIVEKARYVHKSVTQDKNPLMVKNCCDFDKLEAAYDHYLQTEAEKEKAQLVSSQERSQKILETAPPSSKSETGQLSPEHDEYLQEQEGEYSQKKTSVKDLIGAAKAEADRRNSARAADHPRPSKHEFER